MKLFEYLALSDQGRNAQSSLVPFVVAVVALVACKALDLSLAASVGVVIIISVVSAALYVGALRARARRGGTNPPR